jgi:hypothetical protein
MGAREMRVFPSLNEVRGQIQIAKEHNEEQPHESLGNMTREFLLTDKPEASSY